MKARDVMTRSVVTVRPETSVRAAADLLCSHGFTAAPVQRGTNSTREAVNEVVSRRKRRISPCVVTIQMS